MTSIYEAVQAVCLGLPETDEIVSHGFPNFRVNEKIFATYSVNHHGDGKVALLLNIGREMQQVLVESAPAIFFVPPYTGPKGWVGIELNQRLKWSRVSQLAFDAWSRLAPTSLARGSAAVPAVEPDEEMRPEDINPMLSAANQALLSKIREICMALPEVTEDKQFGDPCFRAGKKTFCVVGVRNRDKTRTYLQFWVGPDRQSQLTSFDKRFSIPPYIGHRGWIDLTLNTKSKMTEVSELLMISYRHFALKRMLKALGDEGDSE